MRKVSICLCLMALVVATGCSGVQCKTAAAAQMADYATALAPIAQSTVPDPASARAFLGAGSDREAAEVLARSLERNWDPQLALLYAECRTTEPTRQLEQAEGWLREHNQDAVLLYALGVLCERQQLWGKAQTYFEASLALDNTWRTHVALGELLARLERSDEANAHLAAALKLALSELGQPRRVKPGRNTGSEL